MPTFLLECGITPEQAEQLPNGLLLSLRKRLQAGRIGQPWREFVEARNEIRHREMMNLLRQWATQGKDRTPSKPLDYSYLPPLHLSEEEVEQLNRNAWQRLNQEEAEAVLKRVTGG